MKKKKSSWKAWDADYCFEPRSYVPGNVLTNMHEAIPENICFKDMEYVVTINMFF